MPTYEYRCDACEHGFEIEQRITADKLKKCPECKKMKLTRLVGTGNFILKGGGWYADLYSGASNKKSEPPSKSEPKSSAGASGASSSGESKKAGGAKAGDSKKSAKKD